MALPAEAQETPTPKRPAAAPQPSLGDYARNLREKKRVKVKVTPEEAQQIFKAVDDITGFASKDSGLAQKASVKRQLVGQSEVERMVREQSMSEEEKRERQRGLLAMKKFGVLPRDFDMEAFAAELLGESVAGFYDPKTKMISLLDWVPLEEQKSVLAHELTHALQDQNYDLQKWHKQRKAAVADAAKSVVNSDTDAGESSTAGRGVTEGQAMVVMLDFLLAPSGHDLEHSPGLHEYLQERMSYGSEGPVLYRAPLVIRQGMAFPYREGLMFEIALLQQGSRALAFTTALQHPPRLTHEILQPRTYIAHEKIAPVRIPDLHPVLGESVRVQDTGIIGELDVRVFIHQYGSKWLAGELSKAWRGGSYVTVARSPQGQPATTNDVALLYVSRWQSPEAAERFAKFYAAAVAKRYRNAAAAADGKADGKAGGPISSVEIATEEGPVIVEQWPGNMVFVTESFDAETSARLRDAVLATGPGARAAAPVSRNRTQVIKDLDLTLRLASSPELAPLRDAVHDSAMRSVIQVSREAAGH
ncbi:MAG: hypothetical protein LAN64_13545 [Acidobacteriia bacterium]|nr:hypothetical protein [Terriglobia bacterium]